MIEAATFAFLRELAANNDRAWFDANRARYEYAVREPVAALVAAVTTALPRRGSPLEGDVKRSVFRINRDTRFSHDKRPFKTNVGLVWFRQGGSKKSPGVLYLHVDPLGCFVAAAFRKPEPNVLDSIRERIRVHPNRLAAIVAALADAKLALTDHDRLSRMPKGFEDLKGSAIDPVLRLRSFIVRRKLTDAAVRGSALPDKIADFVDDALPLLRFGWDAVDEVAHS